MGRDKHMAGHMRIPWHQIVGDEHLTFYASYQKKIDSSQVLWKLEIDGKSQNRPFLHFNA